jgi:hypothetical protein
MKKYFHIVFIITFGYVISGFVWSGDIDLNSITKPAFSQCTSGPCNGQIECDCNGRGGPGTNPFCCSRPPPPLIATNCAGGCAFATGACDVVNDRHPETQIYFATELRELERWMMQDWIAGYLIPSMMGMAEEITTVAMHQVFMIGTFFDAEMTNDTSATLREIHAQAHKDYHPSEGVCVFATNVRNLFMSQRKMDMTRNILSTRSLNRHTGIENDAGATGAKTDLGEDFTSIISGTNYRSGRLRQFQDEYCSPIDNNTKLRFLCGNGGNGATDVSRYNNDTNYYDLFAAQNTLYINFLKPEADKTDEEIQDTYDFFALSKNLYGHNVPYRPSTSSLVSVNVNLANLNDDEYPRLSKLMRYHSYLAKLNMAESSFNAQAAEKSEGIPDSGRFLSAILFELGMDNNAVNDFVKSAPSYYAQMEVLTNKLTKDPQFYINLYDKPANVKRKQVALKALNVMQQYDIMEVTQRIELLSSLYLSMQLDEKREDIEGR